MRRIVLLLLIAASALLVAGCSKPARVKVTGQVTSGGKPYSVAARDSLVVVFQSLDEEDVQNKRTRFPGMTKADGKYQISGTQGQGIPPGKYRIVIQHAAARTNEDRLQGRFGPKTSPIIREVHAEPSEQEININLDQPAG